MTKPDRIDWGSLFAWVARLGCVGAMAGFALYMFSLPEAVRTAHGEAQLAILHRYLMHAAFAAASALLLVASVVRRKFLGQSIASIIPDILIAAVALLFSTWFWIGK